MKNKDNFNDEFSSFMIGEYDNYVKYFIESNIERLEKLCDIVLNIFPERVSIVNGKKYHSSSDTIKLIEDYLSTIDKKYSLDFEDKINNGSFVIYDADDVNSEEFNENGRNVFFRNNNIPEFKVENDGDYVNVLRHNYSNIFNIPMFYRITDSFDIVHEFAHSLIKDGGVLSFLFDELVPITFEYDLVKYLEDNNFDENDILEDVCVRINNLIYSVTSLKKALKVYKNNCSNINYDVQINNKINKNISRVLVSNIEYLLGDLFGICYYYDLCNKRVDNSVIKRFINLINKDTKTELSSEFVDNFINELTTYLQDNAENALINIKNKHENVENVKSK